MLRQALSRSRQARGIAARLLNAGVVSAESTGLRAITTSSLKAGSLPIPTEAHGVNYHNPPMEGGYSFFIPRQTLIGPGALKTAGDVVKSLGLKRALIVTDGGLAKSGALDPVLASLKAHDIEAVVFSGAMPNPTDRNVEDAVAMLKENGCDFVVSVGGGSSHDCAKGTVLLATNGGRIHDYEGIGRLHAAPMPLVSVNTTAGTASEMTRFMVITDTTRLLKMVIADAGVTPSIAVDDPGMMMKMPKGLTAATGMDALTHAIEAYLSVISNPVTDASGLHAMRLISAYLRTAVREGADARARDMMSYAQFLGGMAFNSASVGLVHGMAHQLGAVYNLPHGVCNAVILPIVLEFNAETVPHRFIDIAEALGLGQLSAEEAPGRVIDEVRELSADIGIPANLEVLGVKPEDFPLLADKTVVDICCMTNPRPASKEQIIELFRKAYEQGSEGQPRKQAAAA